MEYIILGLLLLKSMTAYEISSFTNKKLALICSGSAGSVQIALKKLLKNGHVSMSEFVQGGINKKVYAITPDGKAAFERWVSSPMQASKVKNMELSKLFFLGFAEEHSRITAIEQYIGQLQEVKNTLLSIKALTFGANTPKHKEMHIANAEDIIAYQAATLDFGIDSAEFEINWYTQLLQRMKR